MRISTLVTSFIQAALFGLLGVRATLMYRNDRDARSAHLALATGLFGTQSLINAISNVVIDTTKGDVIPRGINIATGIMVYVAIFFFLLFLFDFVRVSPVVVSFIGLVTIFLIVMSVLERPDLKIVGTKLVHIPGVHNPISYSTYLGWAIAYLAIAFGVLFFAFLVYAFRVEGLARYRMISISVGFFVIFVAIGLLPRLLFGDPSSATIKNLLNIVRYLALASAPLLLLGFTPPAGLTRALSRDERANASV